MFKGANKIILNQPTMKKAIQEYLKREIVKGAAISVVSVMQDQSDVFGNQTGNFTVEVVEKEQEPTT